LDDHLVKLDAEWDAICGNGTELWRRLRADGFKGGLRVVIEWATRRRRSEKAGQGRPGKPPPARKLSHLMTMRRERLTRAEAVTGGNRRRSVARGCGGGWRHVRGYQGFRQSQSERRDQAASQGQPGLVVAISDPAENTPVKQAMREAPATEFS
jgi:hypothetical protein